MRIRDLIGRDLLPDESALLAINTALNQDKGKGIVGTIAAFPGENTWKARWFCRVGNLLFRTGLIKGFNGVLFISKGLFERASGYDEGRETFEHIDLIKRALACGGRWVYLQDVYVEISLRRYETQGYLKTLLWWTHEGIRYKLGFRSRSWKPASMLRGRKSG